MSKTELFKRRDEIVERNIESAEQFAKEQEQEVVAPKPVAYDANGQPLYAAPLQPDAAQHQVVHVARATEPVPVEISEETKKRHDESVKHFPTLNISDHEYVISAIRRHPIGIILPLLAMCLALALLFVMMFNFPFIAEVLGLGGQSYGMVMLVGILVSILVLIGGYLAVWVYNNNRFFLTNESVVQEIQMSIFSRKEQTVSLGNIEDASFQQHGPVQTLLDYGSIRLSTEGDETTYRFDYVAKPKEQISILNNAVEAFKNGRPVEG